MKWDTTLGGTVFSETRDEDDPDYDVDEPQSGNDEDTSTLK